MHTALPNPQISQKLNFNAHFRRIHEFDSNSGDPTFWPTIKEQLTLNDKSKMLNEKMLQAAHEEFTKIPAKIKKPYLSPATWQLMEEREQCHKLGLSLT